MAEASDNPSKLITEYETLDNGDAHLDLSAHRPPKDSRGEQIDALAAEIAQKDGMIRALAAKLGLSHILDDANG